MRETWVRIARTCAGLATVAGLTAAAALGARQEQVRVVRAFVAGVLGRSHPHADVALLLASELVTNNLRHSGSAVPGGLVTVTVAACGEGVRIEVTERSGDGVPVLKIADGGGAAEGSRGLLLVDALAARWVISAAVGSRPHGSSCPTADISALTMYLASTLCVPGAWCLPAAAQVVSAGCLARYIAGTPEVDPRGHDSFCAVGWCKSAPRRGGPVGWATLSQPHLRSAA